MREKEKNRHYFDWAASAPSDNSASDAAADTAVSRVFANPSSTHREGRAAKDALQNARERCASVLRVPPETLFFTGGGTESNSVALLSNLTREGKGRVIASLAEHSSIREGMETLKKMGKPTGSVAVDSSGKVTVENLENALAKYDDVRFCSIMAVNNEIGSVTDIASLVAVLRGNKKNSYALFHCDLVQAAGKIPLDIAGWGIDSAAISAHKIGGPHGIGLLYLRDKSRVDVLYKGGGQESGIRGGTENIQGAMALASCLEKRAGTAETRENHDRALCRMNRLISAITKTGRCEIIPKERASGTDGFSPYILQAAFKDIPGEVMARALDDLGFAVSTGSACSSASPERPVLQAMGVAENLRLEGIRVSQGYATTDEEIELLIDAIGEVLKFL